MSSNTPNGMVDFYERLLRRLRGRPSPPFLGPSHRGQPRSSHPSGTIDLVGSSTSGPAAEQANTTANHQEVATFGRPGPASGSGLMAPSPSAVAVQKPALAKQWQFSQAVLLKKKGQGARILLWTGIGTFVLVGIWAFTGTLAETIAVSGKLEPGSSTKRIDTPVPGVVEAVLVEEGQAVKQGDPLVRFDLTEPRSKLAAAESVRERLLNENSIAAATLGDPRATGRLTPNQQLQLSSQAEELASRRESVIQELRKAQTRLAGNRSSLATYQNIAQRYDQLERSGAISELQLLEARNTVQEWQTKVAEEEREISRLRAELINTGATTNVELRRKVEANLSEISRLDNDIRVARLQIQYGELKAPTDGLVFDVAVRPGSVVAQGTGASASTSTKPLMSIVPQDSLQAKVFLPNESIGFVAPGMQAEISFSAFDPTDFGTVPAEVVRIGSDALTAEEQARELGQDAQGLFFPAVMRLERQSIKLNTKEAPLQAGMALTADIILRERKLISIFTGLFEDQRRNLERLR